MIWDYPSIALKIMEMQRNQWKGREELEAMQEKKLLALISNARTNAPCYHALPDIRSLDELSSLPLTEKKDLWESDRHISKLFPKEKLTMVSTSGSTGMPLVIYRTKHDVDYFCMLQCSRMISTGVYPLSLVGKVLYQRRNYFFWAPGVFRYLFVSMFEEEGKILSMLKKAKPDILLSYPSTIIPLAHHNLESALGVRVPRVLSNSEVLSEQARKLISGSFGCTIRDLYGAIETGPIAFECEKGNMHVHSDSQIVEVLDKNGEQVKEGQEGEMVVTPLWQQAMPLIRYRLGDSVTLGGQCTCGRGSHTLKNIKGRSVDYIVMRSGRPCPLGLDLFIRNFHNILLFQIIQDEPGKVTIKIVPRGTFTDSSRQALIRTLNENSPEPLDISIEIVKSIPKTRTGKISCVVSSLKPDLPT